ncbi:PDR/VanB family oxidoreductase [Pseudonocardia sp. RS010]|uniref:PDR/VanB family oxidoreductase n=1 Tax=Pseudonocardia sp. RS010 TaxID=3385979 RepID=UPI0039A3C8FB
MRNRPVGGVENEVSLDLVVTEISQLATGVRGIVLRSPSGAALPAWSPGAHVDLHLPGGLVRQYSLCGDPSDRSVWAIGVLREPESRGGSEFLHAGLEVGATLGVRGPRNHFALVPSPQVLFVAGGIGITPMLPMIAEADAAGREWSLLYGGRSLETMAFLDRLARYGERVLVRPEDRHGLLDLDAHLGEPRPDTVIYCCGPEKLLVAVEERCAAWPAGTLHVERFHPRAGVLDGGPSTEFDVVLDQTGQTVRVGADEAIVDALSRIGVDVPTSCREGTCGTCETSVVGGVPDHRDSFLTEAEKADNQTMMICCSRAFSASLTLDL